MESARDGALAIRMCDNIGATMVDPRTLQPKPCPLSDSPKVRWTKPRPHQYVLTWVRHVTDLSLAGVLSSRRRYRSARDVRTDVMGTQLEMKTGLKTPEWFWKCPDCKHRGYVLNGRAMHTS
jgi:hypothetical protein